MPDSPKRLVDEVAGGVVDTVQNMLDTVNSSFPDLPADIDNKVINDVTNLSNSIRQLGESLPDPIEDATDEISSGSMGLPKLPMK